MRHLVTIFAFFTALVVLSGCAMPAPPPDLDVRTIRTTDDGKYVVSLHPLDPAVPVNRIHPWDIAIATADGRAVDGARISFGGGMPQHGHGFPTQPRVTGELGNGHYRLDGVKFSMTGWWEMKLHIQAGDTSEDITFNTVVVAPGADRKLAAK